MIEEENYFNKVNYIILNKFNRKFKNNDKNKRNLKKVNKKNRKKLSMMKNQLLKAKFKIMSLRILTYSIVDLKFKKNHKVKTLSLL